MTAQEAKQQQWAARLAANPSLAAFWGQNGRPQVAIGGAFKEYNANC